MRRLPIGVYLIIGFHLLSAVAWTIGQTGAVFAYDTVARWGFQDPRECLTPPLVAVNQGIALADTVLQIPLFLVAALGLWRRRTYGLVSSYLVLGITAYWPVVAISNQLMLVRSALQHCPMTTSVVAFLAVVALFALWATWYLARRRDFFT